MNDESSTVNNQSSKRKKVNLHVITAANKRTASTGASHVGQNGCNKYCANVSAVIALPVGTKMNRATQRYKNAGNGPNAAPMYA